MKAVILAAGIGSRMRPLTDKTHKSLLPVGSIPIIHHMIRNILKAGINEIIVVTGYKSDQIQNYITTHFSRNIFTFIHNEKYLDTNTGFSLLLTKPYTSNDSFIKFDADVLFEQSILDRLLSCTNSALCIDRAIHLDKEEVKVILNSDNSVQSVGKKLDPQIANGESIGIEKIDRNASEILYQELESLMADPVNYQEYYDDTYSTLVAHGVPFSAVDITGLKWIEIDSLEDYQKANQIFK